MVKIIRAKVEPPKRIFLKIKPAPKPVLFKIKAKGQPKVLLKVKPTPKIKIKGINES